MKGGDAISISRRDHGPKRERTKVNHRKREYFFSTRARALCGMEYPEKGG